MRVIPASQSHRRLPARGWRAHLKRIALATAAIFFLLTLAAGAAHQHGSTSSLHRIDCKACAWVHSASGALGHATPAIVVHSANLAPRAPDAGLPSTFAISTHRGRAPPWFIL